MLPAALHSIATRVACDLRPAVRLAPFQIWCRR